MKLSSFVGDLLETFISFRCLEKKSNVQERRKTGEVQQLVIPPQNAVAGAVDILESDTSPVKTMTVLQSAKLGISIGEKVSDMKADPLGSVQFSGDSDVKPYCKDKLRFLSGGDMQTLYEVGEKSIEQIFG